MSEASAHPVDWETKRLDEVSTKIQDGTHFSPTLGGNQYRYITSRNIGTGRLRLDSVEMISKEEHQKIYRRCDVRFGDLLLTKDGANTGNAAINTLTDEISLLSSVAFIRADHRRSTERYILQYLLSVPGKKQIADAMAGNAITRLTLAKIKALTVPMPPVGEQHRIAEVLRDMDDLITTLERMVAKKQAIKHGMVQQLLSGKVRLPGFTSGAWETRTLREGISLISGTHVMARDCNTQGIGTPYLTGPADFPNGQIKQTKFTTRPVSLCRTGDILITVKGSGSGSMVEADTEYCISRQLMAVRTSKWDSRFLFYSLLHNASQIRAASTGLIPGLSRSDILGQQLPIPPTTVEQNAIAEVLSAIDRQIEDLKHLIAQNLAIKVGMIQQLLSGRTRLPAKESAA
ncbi:hypothetical protein GCM10029992_36230 [Glycomyces albus]